MIQIRLMSMDDVPLGMRLKEQAGWNQTDADWRRFLALEPDGCFVAELDTPGAGRQPVGTATTCVFDSVGWIGMLLVEKDLRGRGIGTQLMSHCLEHLDRRGVPTIRLDATPMGRPIYEKLGFVVEYDLVRVEGVAAGSGSHPGVTPVTPDRLGAVFALDAHIKNTNRRRLIQRLYQERPESMYVFLENEKVLGYVTFRDGTRATQIGPAVALNAEAGRDLGDTALDRLGDRTVFVDIPTDNRSAMRWAESKGLVVQRPLTRMRRGKPVDDQPALQWASSGPEKG